MSKRKPRKPDPTTALAVLSALQEAAPPGCCDVDVRMSDYLLLLTKAGRVRVTARPALSRDSTDLFCRFEVPALTRFVRLHDRAWSLNEYTGKWNHMLEPEPDRAVKWALHLFAPLWPEVGQVAELKFIAAVGEMVRDQEIREWKAILKPDPHPERWLRVIPKCGHLTAWAYCPGCGTDYQGQEERAFFGALGEFVLRQQARL